MTTNNQILWEIHKQQLGWKEMHTDICKCEEREEAANDGQEPQADHYLPE